MTQKEEIFKRIKKTGKLSNADAVYIEKHYWDFKIPMFKKRVKIWKYSREWADRIKNYFIGL